MTTHSNIPTFQHILVPLDGSSLAEEALPVAAQIAQAAGAVLILLRVVVPSSYISVASMDGAYLIEAIQEAAIASAEEYLTQVAAHTYLADIKVQKEVRSGGAPSTLIDFAQTHAVDLIVMRSHGETGFKRWLMGSVAQQVIRHSPIPVLIVREDYPISAVKPEIFKHTPRILVALDGSSHAEVALLPAAQLCTALAAPRQGSIHLTRVVQRLIPIGDESKVHVEHLNKEAWTEAKDYLKNIEQRFHTGDLAMFNLAVTTSVVTYSDVEEITTRIIEESACIGDVLGFSGCDIIAMATHGRHGFQHLLMGSFTEEVLGATKQPLLVVHTPKPAEVEEQRNSRNKKHIPEQSSVK